jgi:hypothetical protein
MNINCQNSAYVGRTNLSRDEQTHQLLQGEIDTLTLNLDTTNSNLSILQTNYDITSNDIYAYLNPLTWLINTETIPASIIPPRPDIINTYIYNSNILGEIRFWVKSTPEFPVVNPIGVPDYRVKIDNDGKLKIYYTYDPAVHATWGNGWIDPAVLLIAGIANDINQDLVISALEGQVIANYNIISGQMSVILVAVEDIQLEIQAIIAQLNTLEGVEMQMINADFADDLKEGLLVCEQAFSVATTRTSLYDLYNNITSFMASGRLNFLARAQGNINNIITNNPVLSFIIGAGGLAVAIGYGIAQNAANNNIINTQMIQAIRDNQNLTAPERRELYEYTSNVLLSSNIIESIKNNFYLNQTQGFINSNVLTQQIIPSIKTNSIIINNINFNDVINNTSNGLITIINNTSNVINNDLGVVRTTLSNLNDNLYLFDEVFTANLNSSYCKKTTFLIQTDNLINHGSVNYYSYTIDLTKYIKYIQVSQYTKQARFKITASLASSVAVFDYLTECEYKIYMSYSSTIGQTGGFHCRAFGIPEDLNLTKFAPYKFIKTNNIYQLTFISAVVGAKFLITIIDEF